MRLIDADRALEIVRDQGIAHPNAYHLTNYATLILQEAPTIEAEPVKHGRWEPQTNNGVYELGCTECGYFPGIKFWTSPYCPNCGAKMDGGADT